MIPVQRVFRCFTRLAIVALMSVGLAGCYDIDATLTFKADGSSALSGRLDFPRDAKHVADLYKALMGLQPGMSAIFDDGLCASIEKGAAMIPQAALDLKTREYTTDARFGCGILYEAGNTDALIGKLSSMPTGTSNVLKVEKIAPQRVRIELDFNNMPDLKQVLPGLVMLGALKYGTPGQGVPDIKAINKVAELYAEASLAMARMMAPSNRVQLAIRAAKVIDTNGDRDGDLVKFRWTWEEFVRLMLKPAEGNREAKIFYAVVEY